MLAIVARASITDAQTNAPSAQNRASSRLNLAVDEATVASHAADARGLPINDLKLEELRILDNSRRRGESKLFICRRTWPSAAES
jgi:hypothetical protein